MCSNFSFSPHVYYTCTLVFIIVNTNYYICIAFQHVSLHPSWFVSLSSLPFYRMRGIPHISLALGCSVEQWEHVIVHFQLLCIRIFEHVIKMFSISFWKTLTLLDPVCLRQTSKGGILPVTFSVVLVLSSSYWLIRAHVPTQNTQQRLRCSIQAILLHILFKMMPFVACPSFPLQWYGF